MCNENEGHSYSLPISKWHILYAFLFVLYDDSSWMQGNFNFSKSNKGFEFLKKIYYSRKESKNNY